MLFVSLFNHKIFVVLKMSSIDTILSHPDALIELKNLELYINVLFSKKIKHQFINMVNPFLSICKNEVNILS